MQKALTGIALFIAVVITQLMSPVTAFACACCAEPGHYYNALTELDEYPLSQLTRMRFARTAFLYLTEAGIEEDGVGIDNPKETYLVNSLFSSNVWRITFRSGTNTGTLELPLPTKMWQHSADIHDGKVSGGGGPSLYKEWRLEGEVKGSGFFRKGTTQTAKYTLVLQGRGNGCDNAEDFTHWRLAVRGVNADFAFHGKLGRPVPQKN